MTQQNNIAPEIPNENHILNIEGFIQTFTEEPTYTPKKFSQQTVLVSAGGSTAIYFYDNVNIRWNYTTLTIA